MTTTNVRSAHPFRRVRAGRSRSRTGIALLSCLWLLALSRTAAAQSPELSPPAPPAVASIRVYRAIDSRLLFGSRGDAGTHLGNTDAGSAGGVLGYLHSEVIASVGGSSSGRRLNDIDAIAVFDVQVLNVRRARLFASSDSPGSNRFGPYMAFNRGLAMPPQARDQIALYGAYVGIQDQTHHPRHAYPGEWYSFVGPCPLSAWQVDENGHPDKPSPCPTTPSLDGICEPGAAAPDGTALCQYTYSYRGYVPLDDLVGITSKDHPLCETGGTARACLDYADFRRNGGVEYSAGGNDTMDCNRNVPESGLPFWRGRCDPDKALARIQALTDWSPLVLPQHPAKNGGRS